MDHVKLLSMELKRAGWGQEAFSIHMGWHRNKLYNWNKQVHRPYVSQMEDCWQKLGYTLLPARMPSIAPRLVNGKSTHNPPYASDTHKIVAMLLMEIDQRNLSRRGVAEAAGYEHDSLLRWSKDPRGGHMDSVEACWNVMGMSLLPFPISTLGAIHAAA